MEEFSNFLRNISFVVIIIGSLWFLNSVLGIEPTKDRESPFAEMAHEGNGHGHTSHAQNGHETKSEKTHTDNHAHAASTPQPSSDKSSLSTSDEKALTAYFENQLEEYITEYADLPAGRNRTDLTVRYYYHEPDNERVQSLKLLKLYLHIRPVSETLRGHQSNSLYYGDSVNTRDIQLIAYTLLKNGIPLKQIVPSQYHNDWKAKAVEIGSDVDYVQAPLITLDEIKKFKNDLLSSKSK